MCSKCAETTNLLVQEDYHSPSGQSPPRHGRYLRLPNGHSLLFTQMHDARGDEGSLLAVDASTLSTRPTDPLDWLFPQFPSIPKTVFDYSVAAVHVIPNTHAKCNTGSNCSQLWPENSTWADWNVIAISCILYLCARYLNAEIRNGQLIETVVHEEAYEPARNSRGLERFSYVSPCSVNGVVYDTYNIPLAPRENSFVLVS